MGRFVAPPFRAMQEGYIVDPRRDSEVVMKDFKKYVERCCDVIETKVKRDREVVMKDIKTYEFMLEYGEGMQRCVDETLE
eukprot:4854909-Heterocapsa_arctica.AAC.1